LKDYQASQDRQYKTLKFKELLDKEAITDEKQLSQIEILKHHEAEE